MKFDYFYQILVTFADYINFTYIKGQIFPKFIIYRKLSKLYQTHFLRVNRDFNYN